MTKLNDILNNAPEPDSEPNELIIPTEPRRVTFDKTAKSPQIEELIPTPTVTRPMERTQPEQMHKVTINKIIPNAQTPRVKKTNSNPNNRERIRNYIAAKAMSCIPTRNSYLRQSTRTMERAQTICDEETNTYLKYRQLMQHPKIQGSMIQIIRQQIWEISQWISRWENREADQNNSIHQKRRCSSGQKERCDVQKF